MAFYIKTILVSALMFQYDGNGSPNEDDIEPDVPVSYVPGIHLDSFVIGRITAAAGLPHAGDAGRTI